jgi:hypothetical protein
MTVKTITITYAQLKKLGACKDQLRLFKARHGSSVKISRKNVAKKAEGFDINWLARETLSPSALADYIAKRAPLDAGYIARLAPLWADYAAECALPSADYNAECALLWLDAYSKKGDR